ncbi:hypothetical protein EI77_01674 [Prosthecobacter fusiformis]|uniref:Uncharacterized protein n=1 Tax=Prosthecobacter fusiformis TaxID=48464 RepID=A0A4R7S6A6_9BACT|nr:hypothetical protein EI77_01674 [Prosthecobacter fusiformis]
MQGVGYQMAGDGDFMGKHIPIGDGGGSVAASDAGYFIIFIMRKYEWQCLMMSEKGG